MTFCNTRLTIINWSTKKINKTILLILNHIEYLYLDFNYSNEIYIHNLGKKINLSEFEKVFYGKCIPKIVKFRENITSTGNELFIMS